MSTNQRKGFRKTNKPAPPMAPDVGDVVSVIPHEEEPTRQTVYDGLLKELEGTSNAIALYNRDLNPKEKKKVADLEENMGFWLEDLVLESKIKEAAIKVATMRQVLDVVRKEPKAKKSKHGN